VLDYAISIKRNDVLLKDSMKFKGTAIISLGKRASHIYNFIDDNTDIPRQSLSEQPYTYKL